MLDGIGLCISSDNGKTFSKPNIIKLKNGWKNFAIRGNMIKIGNEILAPIYAYKKTLNRNSKNKNDKYQCYIISSKDFINWEIKTLLCETEIKKNNDSSVINNSKKCQALNKLLSSQFYIEKFMSKNKIRC